MPYRWIAYVLMWYIFQMYPPYLRMTYTSEEYLITHILISVVVILFCSYKFGSEKGKVLGILMFLVGVLIDVFIALMPLIIFLGMNWDWTGIINSLDLYSSFFYSYFCYLTKVSHPLKHCLFSFTFAYRPPYSLTFNTWLTEVM